MRTIMNNRIDHLAIIMDGNGRWAKNRGLSRLKGHEAGTRAARAIVEAAKDRGITYLTLYAFSSENWKRPQDEVEGLFSILEGFIDREVDRLMEGGVCLHTIGDISKLPERLRQKIVQTIEKTRANTGIHLAVALNYGGRDEIVRACRKIAMEKTPPELITEESLPGFLDTSFMPDPDLLVRTGGEWRISNFLLWQLAYTEIFFTDTLWPDFDGEALDHAIAWYGSRQRRFGMTPEQVEGKETP
jgi:undecaprenyl diphosphate synthase